jgi:putative ATPase
MAIPLAERLRPRCFDDVVGQNHLLNKNGFITTTIGKGTPLSIILWGPPGTGKTTIARLYAQAFSARFVTFNATLSGIADIRKVVAEAKSSPLFQTVLFVDEIHRFNKAQQDAFLPYLENGTFTLIGATTENPSFALNNPLLSRVRVLTLNALNDSDLQGILSRYEKEHRPLPFTAAAREYLLTAAQGDGRYLINMIENVEHLPADSEPLDVEALMTMIQKRSAHFDKSGDGHYNLISALQKSIRGSDPQASLYWFSRIIEGGEDPLYIARRLVRIASEDVGLADPTALQQALAAREAYHMLGSPEGELALAQAVLYLALAPKSNALYTAFAAAKEAAHTTTHLPPPKNILNAPTSLMKECGYGEGYIYDHDTPEGFSGQEYFPEKMEREMFYNPKERGFEREMLRRIKYFASLRPEQKKTPCKR